MALVRVKTSRCHLSKLKTFLPCFFCAVWCLISHQLHKTCISGWSIINGELEGEVSRTHLFIDNEVSICFFFFNLFYFVIWVGPVLGLTCERWYVLSLEKLYKIDLMWSYLPLMNPTQSQLPQTHNLTTQTSNQVYRSFLSRGSMSIKNNLSNLVLIHTTLPRPQFWDNTAYVVINIKPSISHFPSYSMINFGNIYTI